MGILPEMLVCEDMTSCTDLMLSTRLLLLLLVAASIFLVNAASCKTIHGMVSDCQLEVETYPQPFCLPSITTHVHMLICI